MRVAADTRHAANAEVKRLERPQTCLLNERHNERPEAAIDVQSDIVTVCQVTECDDVVGVAVGEVYRRANDL